MAAEEQLRSSSVQEEEYRGGEGITGAAAAATGETAEKPEHGGEQKAPAAGPVGPLTGKRRRIIQEHLQLTEEAIAKLRDEGERAQMVAVAKSLRRQEATADEDELRCPPRPMAPEVVASFRRTAEADHEATIGELQRGLARFLPGGAAEATAFADGLLECHRRAKEHAARLMEEYEAKGYIHDYRAEDFHLPPNYYHLLAKRHER